MVRGSLRRGLGARVEEYERQGTADFFAGDYRPPPATGTCPVCRAPGEHCLCAADPDALRYALAQISVLHSSRDGMCCGCVMQAVLCGYLALLRQFRTTRSTPWAPLPAGVHLSGGV